MAALVAGCQTAGTITTIYDADLGIIRVNATGFWGPGEIEKSFERMAFLRRNVLLGRHLRVLVDRRDTVVQSTEAAASLQEMTQSFFNPGDRVAVIVDSSLAKLQLRRVLASDSHNLFISETAALLWLQAGEISHPDLAICQERRNGAHAWRQRDSSNEPSMP